MSAAMSAANGWASGYVGGGMVSATISATMAGRVVLPANPVYCWLLFARLVCQILI